MYILIIVKELNNNFMFKRIFKDKNHIWVYESNASKRKKRKINMEKKKKL